MRAIAYALTAFALVLAGSGVAQTLDQIALGSADGAARDAQGMMHPDDATDTAGTAIDLALSVLTNLPGFTEAALDLTLEKVGPVQQQAYAQLDAAGAVVRGIAGQFDGALCVGCHVVAARDLATPAQSAVLDLSHQGDGPAQTGLDETFVAIEGAKAGESPDLAWQGPAAQQWAGDAQAAAHRAGAAMGDASAQFVATESAQLPATPSIPALPDEQVPDAQLPSVPDAPALPEPQAPDVQLPEVQPPSVPDVPALPDAALPEAQLPDVPSAPEFGLPDASSLPGLPL